MPDIYLDLKVLFLLWVANGAPIISSWLLGKHYSTPIDFGYKLPDHHALFGKSKTWRGLIAALIFTVPLAMLFGFKLQSAIFFTCASMLGDLLSSFIKRRRGIAASQRALLLDQVPEALFPVALLVALQQLNWLHAVVIVFVFVLTDVTFSRILYRWHIRKRPY